MTTPPIPEPLRRAFDTWNESGRQPDEPTVWRADRWSAWVPEDLPAAGPISRSDLIDIAGRVRSDDVGSAKKAFVAAMVWGYGRVGYGPSRVQRIMSEPGFEEQLARLTAMTLDEGGVAGYGLVHDRREAGDPFLKHLGSGFGTKYLYALTKAQKPGAVTPVLDSVVRRWFAQNAPSVEVDTGARWGCPDCYATYVETLGSWGEELGDIAADDVERLIFLSQQGVAGGTWQEGWLSATPVLGISELLRMVGERFVDLGLEDEAAEPLERLSRLVDDGDPED